MQIQGLTAKFHKIFKQKQDLTAKFSTIFMHKKDLTNLLDKTDDGLEKLPRFLPSDME